MGMVEDFKDISVRKRMEEELRSQSVTDELTGIYNRRGLFTLAGQELRMANRMKRGIFLLYADLDGLKAVNDTFGHEEGDRAIVAFADILKTTYRESDIIARIGGDEFVVIPIGVSGDNVETIISRLQRNIDGYNTRTNLAYRLSASVGVAYYDPEHPCTFDDLLLQGDRIMYEQKRAKRKP
jgi:diguanylate cyclase (GGDEF)-like protein